MKTVLLLTLCALVSGCSGVSHFFMNRKLPTVLEVEDRPAAAVAAGEYAAGIPGSYPMHYVAVTGAMSRSLDRDGVLLVEPVIFADVESGDLVALRTDNGQVIVRWVTGRSLGALLTHSDYRGEPDRFPSFGRRGPRADRPEWSEFDSRANGRSYARNLLGRVRRAWLIKGGE